MKTIKSKFLVLSLILFTAIAFSSCDKDEFEWRKAEILKPEKFSTPSNGNITHTITLTKDWVDVTNGGKYIDVVDVTYTEGEIEIYKGPYIDYLTFNIIGTDIGFRYDINSDKGYIIDDAAPGRKLFFQEIVEIIRRNQVATIAVGGRANPNVEIDMDIYFKVNAEVSY